MNPMSAILWGAVGGMLAAWLTRKAPALGSLSVRGGTVSIDNSDAVEERPAYRYLGETTELATTGNVRAGAVIQTLPLVNGRIYDVIPVVPIQGESMDLTKDRVQGLMVRGFPNGVPRSRWVQSWSPVVLTVQEQISNQMVVVPNWARPDDTERI